jgi:hypothetical protein
VTCRHTLFIATDLGFNYVADQCIDAFDELGYKLVDGDCVDAITHADAVPDEDGVYEELLSPDSVIPELTFPDGLVIASYVGIPSGFGSYVGFATLDE